MAGRCGPCTAWLRIVSAATALGLAACAPEAPPPVGAQRAADLALRRCTALALQAFPHVSANTLVAPGVYTTNGIACRPDPVFGTACAPRANWLPPAAGDPAAHGEARAALVRACLARSGVPAPVY
ncbi:hypothetical protein EDC64_10343 [Aquabacter spiritensis]|uniref:Lipoprotein n=1 Tax=Aquabacter spiritensis TaxID=933073 RepID=A0A4R3LZ38_9HYPH|nr:hypothetical protein EDC64_10343 [Aquabacter spiritensis]